MLEYIVVVLAVLSIIISTKRSAVITISSTLFIIFFIEIIMLEMGDSLYSVAFNPAEPDILRFFTSMFTHASAPHIIINVLVFLLVGIPLEDRDGNICILLYFFIGGITGNIFYYFSHLGQNSPVLGASGCIFGILGAFLIRYPNEEISMFLGFVFMRRVKAKYAILTMAIIESLATFLLTSDNIAHIAHVGGFIAGVFIGKFVPREWKRKSYVNFSSLYNIAETEEDRAYVDRIIAEDDPMVRRALIEKFLEKKCKKYVIKSGYVICDGKKYKFQSLRRR